MQKIISKDLKGFEYYIKGENPKLLIHSGTHGDEFEVIDFVKKYVELFENRLPDFLFVPVVSPSAVNAKTRTNENGHDLNRIFFNDSTEAEIKENLKILNGYKFDLMVSFHEDPETDKYYIYDEGLDASESIKVLKHNQLLKSLGIELLNGVDDPNDPHLGFEFVEGYRKFVVDKEKSMGGNATAWALLEEKALDSLVPEIPGKLDLSKKELIVKTFFENVLIN